jgi:hypothetical protein
LMHLSVRTLSLRTHLRAKDAAGDDVELWLIRVPVDVSGATASTGVTVVEGATFLRLMWLV